MAAGMSGREWSAKAPKGGYQPPAFFTEDALSLIAETTLAGIP